jgi:hypothetical protein
MKPLCSYFIFLSLFAQLLIYSCKRTEEPVIDLNDPCVRFLHCQPDTLPDKTQIGANTFGCIMQDTVWTTSRLDCPCKPSDSPVFCLYTKYNLNIDSLSNNKLNARLWKSGEYEEYFWIVLPKDKRVGDFYVYAHPWKTQNFDVELTLTKFTPTRMVKTYCPKAVDSTYSENRLTITKIDLQSEIVSGTFNLKLYRAPDWKFLIGNVDRDTLLDFSDSIVIKDGRFDAKIIFQ